MSPSVHPVASNVVSSIIGLRQACFVAGTPLLTPEGSKPIEQFRVGDLVLSRAEDDLEGSLTAKAVEEVFVLSGSILNLQVDGRVIRTTAEHPFWVIGKGWLSCRQLEVGDRLSGTDGRTSLVEALTDTDEYRTVFNLRIADYHTYFVGDDEWGFSVWAHNANCDFRRISSQGEDVFENAGKSRRVFEKLRKSNLDPPNNFPTIDRINRSSALGTSMKTIDLTTKIAGNPIDFRRLVRGYVEKLRDFQGPAQRWSNALGDYVRVPQLKARRLEIGVQSGMLTDTQRSILRQEARRAGRLKNSVQFAVFEIF